MTAQGPQFSPMLFKHALALSAALAKVYFKETFTDGSIHLLTSESMV
jgi:hypothetical protein